MVTDDERRRVAAALRDKYRERESGRWFIPQMEGMYERDYLKDLESCLLDGKSMFTVLADLIEPSCDRDALLELLRMFEADASLAPFQSEEDAAHETLYTRANVIDHIRRMRKALGVGDD